ncbi:hypothetical protein ACQEVZ_24635 [Dactylosporangium sp. CA-152071]|uniref:hypothetical protein n=1 Tax=Dactylosporangium sp. CA-152071 TaxID=3239933 RepID=UPI003D8FBDA7
MTGQQGDQPGDYVDERGVTITAVGCARMRAKLDELNTRWTPEQRAERRAALGARIDGAIDERRAEREADPVAFWRARGEEAAREVVQRERYLPAEALEPYRAAFDVALREERVQAAGPGDEGREQRAPAS